MKLIHILPLAFVLSMPAAMAAEDVVVVYDASGSMWGQVDGVSKIEVARDVMGELIENWSDETNLGLVAYGHRREADCNDIETVIAPGPVDRERFVSTINEIRPYGRTPLSASVEHAAELLAWRDNPATVVLISDGLETCQADPCALSAQLAEQGVGFTAHVVGFDLTQEEHEQLACIAENTGGIFVPAQDAAELRDAIDQVQDVIDLEPISPAMPKPSPEPVDDVIPQAEISMTAPEQITVGSAFTVSWSEIIESSDYVSIVPMGADEGETGGYLVVREVLEGVLTAPAEPGRYEVRYILNEGRVTMGSASVEVTEAAISVTAPEQVTTGAVFPVAWSETINTADYVSIVPMGADEGETGDYLVVREVLEGALTAPAEPGLYEVRYILNEGRVTMGSANVEVTEATVSVTAPEQVTTGATFPVAWQGTVNTADYVVIVPQDAEASDSGNYLVVRDASEGSLTAPSEAGIYEVRYILNEGRRVLARTNVEVAEPEIVVTGPGTVRAEASVAVSWSTTINSSDYITIVPAGAEDGTWDEYLVIRDASEGELTAPSEPGLYEVRYVLNEDRRTMAKDSFEVVAADAPLDDGAGLSVPAEATPGETIAISWTLDSAGANHRVALARVDQPDFSWIEAQPVNADKILKVTLPDEPGTFEVRFLDIGTQSVLGRSIVEAQ